jgi:selenide,water dikinase
VLTKPLGTGVIATALKRTLASLKHIEAAIAGMITLNDSACRAMLQTGAHSCTDVTGFGLIGHAREMAAASKVTIRIEVSSVPLLPGAYDYANAGAIPGGLNNNREFASPCVAPASIDSALEALLYDPQTSGGLLIALPEEDVSLLASLYPPARRIGSVAERRDSLIELI